MAMISRCGRVVLAVTAGACLSPAWADCVDGERQPSAAETDFHERALAALVASLPAAPPGVELRGARLDIDKLPPVGLICKDDRQKEGNFDLQVRRAYFLKQGQAEYDRLLAEHTALRNQVEALEQLPPETVAERAELNRKRDSAYSASMKAGRAGDKAAEKSLQAESEALNAQSTALLNRHLEAVKPRIAPLRQRQQEIVVLNQGQEVRVGVAMNVARLPVPSAAATGGSYGAASPQRSLGLKVHNVVWGVGGSGRALQQALVAAIDAGRLQSLVGKPLPTRAESAALAVRAAPASLPATPPATQRATAAVTAPSPVAPAVAAAVVSTPPESSAPPAAVAPVAAAAPVPASAAPAASPADLKKQAGEAVNKLRGLFGR